jgi:leucyl-tRNA synthetase
VLNSTEALESFSLRDHVQHSFFNLLNAWDYFSRRSTEAEKAFVAKEIAEKWTLLLCPVTPHICEELWEKQGNKGFASLAAWPEAREERITPEIEQAEDYVAAVFADLRKIRELVKIRATKATIVIASKAKGASLASALKKAAKPEELALDDEALKQYAGRNFFELKSKAKLDELAALNQAADFLSKETGLSVCVEREEDSKEEKKARAMPFKPSIILS